MKIQKHQSYLYAQKVCWGEIIAPRYVKKQCSIFLDTADNKSEKYCVNSETVELIDSILKLLIMPRGLKAGKTVHEALAEFQFFLIVAVLCTVYKKIKT